MKRKRSEVTFRRLYETEPKFKQIFDKIKDKVVRDYNLSYKVDQSLESCGMESGIPGEIYVELRDLILQMDEESEYDDGYTYEDVVYADVMYGINNKKYIYLRDKNHTLIKIVEFEDWFFLSTQFFLILNL